MLKPPIQHGETQLKTHVESWLESANVPSIYAYEHLDTVSPVVGKLERILETNTSDCFHRHQLFFNQIVLILYSSRLLLY